MHPLAKLLTAFGAMLGLAGCEPATPSAQPATDAAQGAVIRHADMAFGDLARRDLFVWTPLGYDAGDARFPLLIIQDGQNLFSAETAVFGVEWGVDETMTRLIADQDIRPAIVLGIASSAERFREYFPQAGFDGLSGDDQAMLQAEIGGPPLSTRYLKVLVDEILPWAKRNYRVLEGPENHFLMGSSMGGLISIQALIDYPDVFGGAAALSTHWPMSLDENLLRSEAPDLAARSAAFLAHIEARLPALADRRLYMDHGDQHLDQYYAPHQAKVDAVLTDKAGAFKLIWRSERFPGTSHNEASWAARLDQPVGFLLGTPLRSD